MGHGHGHGHGQQVERAHLSSVAAPLGTSPEASHEYVVLTATPTTTKNNALDSITHLIDNTFDTLDIPMPDSPIFRRPHGHDHDYDIEMNHRHTAALEFHPSRRPSCMLSMHVPAGERLPCGSSRSSRITQDRIGRAPLPQGTGSHRKFITCSRARRYMHRATLYRPGTIPSRGSNSM